MHQQPTGALLPRHGSAGIGVAPHGIDPPGGNDRWIVLSAQRDAEWSALATVAALCWGADERVLRPAQLDDDGHLLARGSRIEMSRDHVPDARYTALPFKFPATPGVVHRPGPTLGRDNDAVLGGRLGLSPEELTALRDARVIGETIDL